MGNKFRGEIDRNPERCGGGDFKEKSCMQINTYSLQLDG